MLIFLELNCFRIAMRSTDLTPAFFQFESFTAFGFYSAYVAAVCMILADFKVIIFAIFLLSCCILLLFCLYCSLGLLLGVL